MICPNCGFENPDGSFCGNCGSSLPAHAASIYQPPTPKRKGKKVLMVAVIAIIVVVAVVLAAVMFVLPKDSQSSPSAAIDTYFEGVNDHDAARIMDSTIMHFDTANRTILMNSFNSSWSNMVSANITVISTEDVSTSNVPVDIKVDVTNFTNVLQKVYKIAIQDSQFEKITVKQTNSSTDSFSSTAYVLFSKVDGKWYLDLYVSYTPAEWAADRSMADKGWSYFLT
jgi:uncharacterized membrane protein YvbJ